MLKIKNLFRCNVEVVLGAISISICAAHALSLFLGATVALVPAYNYVFTFRPKWWVIAVAVCTVAMVVETTVKGAFV